MPALNFMKRLAPLIESGAKRHTVRRKAKRPIKSGDSLYLFTGMRTKHCRRLMDTECTHVQRIQIRSDRTLHIGATRVPYIAADDFAKADGLRDFAELAVWISDNYGLPFDGVVIHWRYNTRPEE